MRSPEAPNTTRLHGSACLNACGAPLPIMPCLPCDLRLQAGLDVSTKALPHGGEHFLGEGVLFARAETGISLKNGLCNSVPASCAIPRSCPFGRSLRVGVILSPDDF